MAAEQILKVEDSMYPMSLATTVQDFNTYSKFTDLCFVCKNGTKVKAHKLLLCSLSNFMKGIFMSMCECLLSEELTILVPDIDSSTLNLLMDFLYEGSIKVTEAQYPLVQDAMTTLGIVLQDNSKPVQQSSATQPMQPPPQPQVVYVPTTPNSQGQLQYVMATPAASAQASSLPQQSVSSSSGPMPMMLAQANGHIIMTPMVQNSGSMPMQPSSQPMIMTQASMGQMVIAQPQATQQIMTQANSHLMAGHVQNFNTGQQMMSSQPGAMSSQPVVMSSQPVVMSPNANQMPIMMQNQNNCLVNRPGLQPTAQTNRQHNQNLTRQPQPQPTALRGPQNQRPVNLNAKGEAEVKVSAADIVSVLESREDFVELTGQAIREILEVKLGVDLTAQQQHIEQVFNSFMASLSSFSPPESILPDTSTRSFPKGLEKQKPPLPKRKKIFPFSKSDDEADEDFNPGGKRSSKSGNRRKR